MVDKGAKFGGSVKRMGCYAEHKVYQGETADPTNPKFLKKIIAGPLESEDGKYMIGSVFIVYSTREEAETFIHNDPFFKMDVWAKV